MYNLVGVPAAQHMTLRFIYNFIPFRDFGEPMFLFQIGANALLFVPLGFLLPVIWERYRSFWRTLLAGFVTSLGIEALQIFCFRATDVDDLIMNTLGGAIGYGIYRIAFRKKWESVPKGAPRKDLLELLLIHAIALLVIVFVRTLISDAVYRLLPPA